MPRFRLAARFLRVRSSPPCEAATSFAPLNPSSPPSAWRPSSSLAPRPFVVSEKEKRPPRFFRIISHHQTTAGTEIRDRASSYPHVSRPAVAGLPLSGHVHRHDLIFGVKPQQEASSLGRCRGLHSLSSDTGDSEHDQIDGLQRQASPVSPGLEKCGASQGFQESEEEDDGEADDGEEVFSSQDETPVSGGERRSSTCLYDGEDEGTGELEVPLLMSSEDESDLSELEFVGRVDRVPEETEDGDFDGAESRPEEEGDTQWTGAGLDRLSYGASPETEEGMPELFSGFSGVVSSEGEDADVGGLMESELGGDDPEEGLPYLHSLSVAEVREILEKARAKDVRILQVRKGCEWVDHMVFASGRSSRHLRGMADAIVYKVKQLSENVGPNSFPPVEGRDGEQWMAIDCSNIVIHLFLEDARSYYNLEEFWTKKSNPRLVETY